LQRALRNVRNDRYHGTVTLDALADQPIATAEFLVLDTETNGLSGDQCELTEVGAVLVGGGELHDRFSSLVRTNMPLRRGIQRFTGITQAMVDGAPDLDAVLPELEDRMRGRVMVAHNAPFDRRVLRQAFERIGLDWPAPPTLCTVSLSRALMPLQGRRGLGPVADALGIEVETQHRALADAETCARVLCALFPRLCANAATRGKGRESHLATQRTPSGSRSWTSVTYRRTPAYICSVTRAGALSTSASRSRFARALERTSRPRACPRAGPLRRGSSTTARHAQSSARWYSRTG
jgi:DNA polymerase III epsilon subunit family exonuclease